jgi:hypothetical protein
MFSCEVINTELMQYNIVKYFSFFLCFNATFRNISAISWRPVLVVEEAGVTGEPPGPKYFWCNG